MLTSIRSLLAASALVGALFSAAPAMAQDESGITVSGSAAVVSQYRFRGVSMTEGNPALQAGITVSHDSGFYIATWGSSIHAANSSIDLDDGTGLVDTYDAGNYGSLELDVFGGWTGEVAPGTTIDVGLLYYIYPDALNRNATFGPAGTSGYPEFTGYTDYDTDYLEPYASISHSFGPATVKVGAAYAWKQDSLGGDDNLYLYGNVDIGVPNTPITISGHLGYADGVQSPDLLAGGTDGSSFDYSIGASAQLFGPLSVGVAYIDTTGTSVNDFTDGAIVGTLLATF